MCWFQDIFQRPNLPHFSDVEKGQAMKKYTFTASTFFSLFACALLCCSNNPNDLGFDCLVVPSLDRAFPDKLAHSLPGAAPYLARRDTVYAGLPWGMHVLFREYSRDTSGKVDLSFSYKIIRPNGALFLDTTGISAVSGKIAKDAGLLPSQCIPVFSFSRKDAPGTYKIIATAEDRIGKTKKKREARIVLSKYPEIASTRFDDVSLNIWIHNYCIKPDPGRAVAAFYHFIESNLSNDNEIFWPVLYFFQCVFHNHPFLVDELIGNYPKCSQRLREYSVFLLRSIQFEKGVSTSAIPDSLWKKFDKVAETGFYDPFTFAFKIKSNRFMEFGFYYYGRYVMIRFLIDCLGLNTQAGYETFRKNCPEYCDDCLKTIDKETAREFYSVAKKILEKTYPKHQLINAYCNYAYERGNLEINAKKALKKIIDSSKN
jgi:hypothetical protein